MKLNFILLISIVLIFTSIGCSPATVTIKESNQNEKYCIKKGDILEIELNANPSTGYNWQITHHDNSKLKIIDETYIAKKVKRGMVGSGGKKIYIFNAIDKGNTIIELHYSRPFEKEGPYKKKFHINLEIR